MNIKLFGNILAASGIALVFLLVWGFTVLMVFTSVSSRRLSTGEKTLWVALAVALPLIGAFLYLLTRIFAGLAAPAKPEPPARQDSTELQLPPIPPGFSPTTAHSQQVSSSPGLPGYRLVVTHGPCAGSSFILDRLPARVGRGVDAAIRLEDDQRVSRQHAELFLRGSDLMIRDLGSMHGLVVNGVQAKEQRLKPGDTILVGDSTLLVERLG